MGASSSKKSSETSKVDSRQVKRAPLYRGDSSQQIEEVVREKPGRVAKYTLASANTDSSYHEADESYVPRSSPSQGDVRSPTETTRTGRTGAEQQRTGPHLPHAASGRDDSFDASAGYVPVLPLALNCIATCGSDDSPPSPPAMAEEIHSQRRSSRDFTIGTTAAASTSACSAASDDSPSEIEPIPSETVPDISSPRPTPPAGPHRAQGARVVSPSTSINEEDAANRIQRLLKNKAHRAKVRRMHEWKIFSDLDAKDEAHMLMLANFMHTLMERVPNYRNNVEGGDEDTLPLHRDSESVESEVFGMSDVQVQLSSRIHIAHGNRMNYVLNTDVVNDNVVSELIDLYKQGGKLCGPSAISILRKAYKLLKTEPNIVQATLGPAEKLVIVGDLHGQYNDLVYILDDNGFPSESNRYIFNGDFVDRGSEGVEVLITLFALYSAYPKYVTLNRGNHEEYAICCIYGFQKECLRKYDEVFFGMFCEIFNYLPICTVINSAVLVIHGGLFHDPDVLLSDIEEIDRTDYKIVNDARSGIPSKGSFAKRSEYLSRIFREALWSDPTNDNNLRLSTRGSGVLFGPAHTRKFLDNNKLSMIVRSHECVREGYKFPFSGANSHALCTVFSASNYSGSGNSAAYMVITRHHITDAIRIEGTDLFFTLRTFTTKMSTDSETLGMRNHLTLKEVLCRKRRALQMRFEAFDVDESGFIPAAKWAEIMLAITGLRILWTPLIPSIVPPDAVSEGHCIDYMQFLRSLSTGNSEGENNLGAMYGPIDKLELIFNFFDKDGNGQISRAEFRAGCEFLNQSLPPDAQLKNIDEILGMMDLDGSDSIDRNELFEVFRLVDAQDGVVDGVISLAQCHAELVQQKTDSRGARGPISVPSHV